MSRTHGAIPGANLLSARGGSQRQLLYAVHGRTERDGADGTIYKNGCRPRGRLVRVPLRKLGQGKEREKACGGYMAGTRSWSFSGVV